MIKKIWLMAGAITLAVGLSGCGGGGGGGGTSAATDPTVISGTAATGLAITGSMNGVVTVKGANGEIASTPTDASGNYAFTASQTAKLTSPYMLEITYAVAGVKYYLHNAATATDLQKQPATINITPLTDLIIANIANDVATNLFNNPSSYSVLTNTTLSAGATALAAQLAPILSQLNLNSSLDFLHQSFTANGTGMDALLDSLNIAIDPVKKTASITNTTNGTSITNNLTVTASANTSTIDVTGAAPLTDLQVITSRLSALGTEISAASSATDPVLLAFFDQTNFRDDGKNLAAFLQQVTTNQVVAGSHITLTNIVLNPIPTTPLPAITFPTGVTSMYHVGFTVLQNSTPSDSHKFYMYKDPATGAWLVMGNQLVAKVQMKSTMTMSQYTTNGANVLTSMCTGFNFDVQDSGGLGLTYAVVKRFHAVDTLFTTPLNTVLLFNDNSGYFQTAAGAPSTFNGTNTLPLNSVANDGTTPCNNNLYSLSDAAIATLLPDDIYVFSLFTNSSWASTNTPVAKYHKTVGALPLTSTQLSASLFASAAKSTPNLITAANAATATISTVSWVAPTATTVGNLYANAVNLWLSDANNANTQNVSVDVAPTAISASFAVPHLSNVATAVMSNISVDYIDANLRQYWTQFMNP